MHRCLKVLEIFHLILTNILDPEEGDYHLRDRETRPGQDQESVSAVASLARTCKTFCEPALDVLWYYQTDLKPLLKCLPRSVLTSQKPKDRVEHLTLHGRVDREDFKRLDFYARRIRILGCSSIFAMNSAQSRPDDIDALLYPTILSRRSVCGLGPLLPNLTSLNIDMIEFCTLAWYPRLISGPQLKHIRVLAFSDDVDSGEYDVHWENVLSILSPALPTLKSLSLSFLDPLFRNQEVDIYQVAIPENRATVKLLQGILSITHLDIISISIDMETLLHIAGIRTITVLGLNVPDSNVSPHHPALETIPELPNLVEFSLCTGNQWVCSLLIRRLSPRKLRKLKAVNSLSTGDTWNIDSILQVLNSARFKSGLEQIDIIRPNYEVRHNPNVQPISSTTIDLLIPFKALNIIRLYQNGEVHLDRECLDRIALQWPTLKVFDLQTRARPAEKPLITLHDMLAFTAMLSNLEEIGLRIDTEINTIYANSSLQLTGVASPSLKILNICTSPLLCGQWLDIAALLAAAFPNLRHLDGFGSYLENGLTPLEIEYRTEWREVATALRGNGVIGVHGLRPVVMYHV